MHTILLSEAGGFAAVSILSMEHAAAVDKNVVRPNKLRVMIRGARFERARVYDGKTVTPFPLAQ